VTLAYTGTASNGIDYVTGITTATIPAGQTGVSFLVTGINDLLVETGETVVIDIDTVLNGFEFGIQTQTVTILDDDIAQVLLTVNTGAMNESGGMATFTVSIS